MVMKIVLFVVLLAALAAPCSAADPVISSAAGHAKEDSLIWVVGSNFGYKTPAAPVCWEDFDRDDLITETYPTGADRIIHSGRTYGGHLDTLGYSEHANTSEVGSASPYDGWRYTTNHLRDGQGMNTRSINYHDSVEPTAQHDMAVLWADANIQLGDSFFISLYSLLENFEVTQGIGLNQWKGWYFAKCSYWTYDHNGYQCWDPIQSRGHIGDRLRFSINRDVGGGRYFYYTNYWVGGGDAGAIQCEACEDGYVDGNYAWMQMTNDNGYWNDWIDDGWNYHENQGAINNLGECDGYWRSWLNGVTGKLTGSSWANDIDGIEEEPDFLCIKSDTFRMRYLTWADRLTGGEDSRSPGDSTPVHIDDVYYDSTWARVQLGNASTFDNCTVREMQIPIYWASDGDSIRLICNTGAFAQDDDAWLYVVNRTGEWNEDGYYVQINTSFGGVPENVAPCDSVKAWTPGG